MAFRRGCGGRWSAYARRGSAWCSGGEARWGPWLTSIFGSVLLIGLPVVILTGLLSYIAYGPQFGQAIPGDVGWLTLPTFDWPSRPSWLYRLSQGVHVGLGLIIIPLVLAKLWSVIPRLFAWPPTRSVAQLLERLSLFLLVGGAGSRSSPESSTSSTTTSSGSFYAPHFYGAWVFIGGFVAHVAFRLPRMITGLRSRSMRDHAAHLPRRHPARTARARRAGGRQPRTTTMSRRGALGTGRRRRRSSSR